jgi:hypothetical protein
MKPSDNSKDEGEMKESERGSKARRNQRKTKTKQKESKGGRKAKQQWMRNERKVKTRSDAKRPQSERNANGERKTELNVKQP